MKKIAIAAFCDRVIKATDNYPFWDYLETVVATMIVPIFGAIWFVINFFVPVELPFLLTLYVYYKAGTGILFLLSEALLPKKHEAFTVVMIAVLLFSIETTIIVFLSERLFGRKEEKYCFV